MKAQGHILNVQLSDNLKAHMLMPDGSYEKADLRGKKEDLCPGGIYGVRPAEGEDASKKEITKEGREYLRAHGG